jgi:hypothetical protein
MSMPVKKDSLTVTGPTKQFTRSADSGIAESASITFWGPYRTWSPSNPALLMTQAGSDRATSSG